LYVFVVLLVVSEVVVVFVSRRSADVSAVHAREVIG
jgi:hypothetical protein